MNDLEPPSERDRKRDRQMIELRVALPGVQILFGFLLTVPFTQRFPKLTSFQGDVFYITLLATTLSTACLIAPRRRTGCASTSTTATG